MKRLILFILLIIALPITAQITTDGTLGPALHLPGTDYQITPDLGQQLGGNLFHSFRDFNLQSWESATFSGPNHIQNVISRVTGGNPSRIDGLFRSTIPNADVYFLNPYGIIFGPNARLDVQGSFHASTADYLRLGDGGRFDARNPNNSILTVAPIESFGFLDNPHGTIEINGRGVLNESGTPRALLQVPEGKNLSLIGGDIFLSQNVEILPLEALLLETLTEASSEEIQATQHRNQRYSQVYAPSGTINLASIRRAGEIKLTKDGINSTAIQNGTIQLEQQAFISTTGKSGGNIFIRAGQFMMDKSIIYARTLGIQDGGIVDIQADNIRLVHSRILGGTEGNGDGTDIQLSATESIQFTKNNSLLTYAGSFVNQEIGDAGHISLRAKNIEINHNSLNGVFTTDTYGTGRGGDVSINAENRLNIISAYIQVSTLGDNALAGRGGNIYLHANTLNMEQGSWVGTASLGSADAGQLVIKAKAIYLGQSKDSFNTRLRTNGFAQGNSGQIIIQADELLLEEGAYVVSSSAGNGNAGDVDIQLTGTLTIRGASANTGIATGIFSAVESGANQYGGNAGNIRIHANKMWIEMGGQINANTYAVHPNASSQNAGNIILNIQEALILSGVNPYGENATGFGSLITARSEGEHAGKAGTIQIQANSVSILDGALIETGSNNLNSGGDIQIQAHEYITIQGNASSIILNEPLSSQLNYLTNTNSETYNQSISGIYAHSTSQSKDSGDSGTIELTTPQLTISNQGQISTASHGGGKAGQIILNVEKLVLNDQALIRSNSELGNQFIFDTLQTRNNSLIGLGTVVKTKDIGNGKATYQINLGNTLVNIMPVTQVADKAALEILPEQINLESNGDIVIVENTDGSQTARFLYVNYEHATKAWTRIDENNYITLAHPDFSLQQLYFAIGSLETPYADGTQIHVKDIGNGKSADFIYTAREFREGQSAGFVLGEVFRVKYYQVSDITALQTLNDSMDLFVGIQVDVAQTQDGNPARFVFDGNNWVRFGQILEVADISARENLILAQPGHIAHLPTGDTIYTGKEWIDLGNTHRANNLAERDALNVQHGDLVKVADVGNGRHDAFLYADGQWIKQVRGGDAGQIIINADKIQLSDGSEISTGSISGGGGAVTLNVDKMVFLTNSQVTTSVQEGVGNGGDLTFNPEFVILENGKIIARANEGKGGNINITTTGIYTFPPKEASTIDASSELGIDGNVEINAPDENVTEGMFALSSEPMDASRMMKKRCEQMSYEDYMNRLRFVVNPIAGSTPSPYDLKESRLSQQSTKKLLTPNQKSGKKPVNLPPRQTAMVTVCRSEKVQEENTPAESENSVMPEQLF